MRSIASGTASFGHSAIQRCDIEVGGSAQSVKTTGQVSIFDVARIPLGAATVGANLR